MQKRDLCFFSFFPSSVKSSQDTSHITFMSGFVHVLPFARKKLVLHVRLSVIRVEQDTLNLFYKNNFYKNKGSNSQKLRLKIKNTLLNVLRLSPFWVFL